MATLYKGMLMSDDESTILYPKTSADNVILNDGISAEAKLGSLNSSLMNHNHDALYLGKTAKASSSATADRANQLVCANYELPVELPRYVDWHMNDHAQDFDIRWAIQYYNGFFIEAYLRSVNVSTPIGMIPVMIVGTAAPTALTCPIGCIYGQP